MTPSNRLSLASQLGCTSRHDKPRSERGRNTRADIISPLPNGWGGGGRAITKALVNTFHCSESFSLGGTSSCCLPRGTEEMDRTAMVLWRAVWAAWRDSFVCHLTDKFGGLAHLSLMEKTLVALAILLVFSIDVYLSFPPIVLLNNSSLHYLLSGLWT